MTSKKLVGMAVVLFAIAPAVWASPLGSPLDAVGAWFDNLVEIVLDLFGVAESDSAELGGAPDAATCGEGEISGCIEPDG